ncbi:hypothetical protein [Staphylococcus xylosus]|uniref:hypothetical protein n=1 Tax=Staphylococcus xylosus TaxID=1288 RepID=UPI003F54D181
MIKNVLTLNESTDGNRIKQGDQSVMRYTLTDTSEDNLELDGKQAIVYLYTDKGVAYKQETTVSNNVVDVVINEIIPTGHYTLEIVVDDKYIFPSDNKTKIEVTSSVLGKGTTEITKQNLYGDLLDYGISNDKFNSFKGEPGLDGKSLTYEDLTDEQKQDLASYVPVKDIPDSHIIDVMKNDYLDGKGQLGYILIENSDDLVPINLVLFYDTTKIEYPEDLKSEYENYLLSYIDYDLQGRRKQFTFDGFIKSVADIGVILPPQQDLYAKVRFNDGQVFVYPNTASFTNNIDIVSTIVDNEGTVEVSYKFNDKPLDEYKLEIGSHS